MTAAWGAPELQTDRTRAALPGKRNSASQRQTPELEGPSTATLLVFLHVCNSVNTSFFLIYVFVTYMFVP